MLVKFIKSKILLKIFITFLFLIKRKRLPLSESSTNLGNCVIVLKLLGDTVFAIPTILELYKQNQNLTIVCYPEGRKILELAGDFNFIVITKNEFNNSFYLPKIKTLFKIRKLQYSKLYDLSCRPIGLICSTQIKANTKLGLHLDYTKSLYDKVFSTIPNPDLMGLNLQLLGENYDRSNVSQENDIKVKSIKNILIHPFAGWKAKEWSLVNFLKLAELLQNKYKTKIVFQSGQVQDDIKEEFINNQIEYVETRSLDELIENIKATDYFIGNDSGPVYIAGLLGKPTFTIYGPTNPISSIQNGNNHKYIRNEINCSPKGIEQYCFTFAGRKGCPSFECMNSLKFEQVYNSVVSFIKEFNAQNSEYRNNSSNV